jgi:hypothetical protein
MDFMCLFAFVLYLVTLSSYYNDDTFTIPQIKIIPPPQSSITSDNNNPLPCSTGIPKCPMDTFYPINFSNKGTYKLNAQTFTIENEGCYCLRIESSKFECDFKYGETLLIKENGLWTLICKCKESKEILPETTNINLKIKNKCTKIRDQCFPGHFDTYLRSCICPDYLKPSFNNTCEPSLFLEDSVSQKSAALVVKDFPLWPRYNTY